VDGLEAKLKEKNSAEEASPTSVTEIEAGALSTREPLVDNTSRAVKGLAVDSKIAQQEQQATRPLPSSDLSRYLLPGGFHRVQRVVTADYITGRHNTAKCKLMRYLTPTSTGFTHDHTIFWTNPPCGSASSSSSFLATLHTQYRQWQLGKFGTPTLKHRASNDKFVDILHMQAATKLRSD
jgi:hypothetical protein